MEADKNINKESTVSSTTNYYNNPTAAALVNWPYEEHLTAIMIDWWHVQPPSEFTERGELLKIMAGVTDINDDLITNLLVFNGNLDEEVDKRCDSVVERYDRKLEQLQADFENNKRALQDERVAKMKHITDKAIRKIKQKRIELAEEIYKERLESNAANANSNPQLGKHAAKKDAKKLLAALNKFCGDKQKNDKI